MSDKKKDKQEKKQSGDKHETKEKYCGNTFEKEVFLDKCGPDRAGKLNLALNLANVFFNLSFNDPFNPPSEDEKKVIFDTYKTLIATAAGTTPGGECCSGTKKVCNPSEILGSTNTITTPALLQDISDTFSALTGESSSSSGIALYFEEAICTSLQDNTNITPIFTPPTS